ncbi:hypothetical protein CPB86DRAFT_788053 [Serendipita vermifera]|nr:hypothetical protein CPB86DRAFT_788053 [Serendipita vermifera]
MRHSSSYRSDDQTTTGLEVHYGPQEHTAPPPNWDQPGHDFPTIWSFYSNLGKSYDSDLVEDSTNTVEVLLIFGGLFSAVVTAFISQTYPMLQPDEKDYLSRIYQELRNPGSSEPFEEPFVPPPYAVRVNSFLFAGLFISMMVAFLSILVKLWTRGYERDLKGISSAHLRSRIRHYRYVGAEKWKFIPIVGFLSLFMQLALFLSAVGIIDLLLSTCKTVGIVALVIFTLGMLAFLVPSCIPPFAPEAPFRSPVSMVFTSWKNNIQSYFQIPRRRNKQSGDGTGLEDTVESPIEGQIEDYKVVRYRLDLDLEILCHLLREADNSTQRWVLDLCFQKLPELTLLQEQHPGLILEKRVITEAYLFLARTCIGLVKGHRAVLSPRVTRAAQLCKFLSWYLSLPRTPEMSHSLRERLPDVEVDELPTTLARDGDTSQVLHALTAKGKLKHLKEDQKDQLQCQICLAAVDELENRVKDDIKRANDPQSQSPDDNQFSFVQELREVLIQITDCILDTEKRAKKEKGEAICQEKCQMNYKKLAAIVELRATSPNAEPKLFNQKELKAFMEEKRKNLDENSVVITEWFDHLEKLLMPPDRQPGSNTRSTTPVNSPGSSSGFGGGGPWGSSHQLRTPSGSIGSPGIRLTPPPFSNANSSAFGNPNSGNFGPYPRG